MQYFRLLKVAMILIILLPLTILAEDQPIREFQRYFSQIKTFQGRFQQVYFDALLDRTSESEGTVLYKKPGLMRWNYERPDQTQIIIGEEVIWVYEPDLENVTVQPIDEVARMDTLAFLLKNENLELFYKTITPQKPLLDKELFALNLTPIKPNNYLVELQLGLDKNNKQLRQFVIIDKQNNYRKVTFSGLKMNQFIEGSQFEFVITEGMEVIDEMDN